MTHTVANNTRGLKRLINAGGYSWSGLKAAYLHEAAFRQELAMTMAMAPLGWWLGDSGGERALLIGSLFVVLIVELLNSAVEAVVDRLGTEHHELSGRAKDLGSAAVFMSLVFLGVVWGLVLLPY